MGGEPPFGSFDGFGGSSNNNNNSSSGLGMGRGRSFDPFGGRGGGGLGDEDDRLGAPPRLADGAASADLSLGEHGWGSSPGGGFSERGGGYGGYGDRRYTGEPSSPPPLGGPAWPSGGSGSGSGASLPTSFTGLRQSAPPGMEGPLGAVVPQPPSSRAEPNSSPHVCN
jgi:hypothetical protein